MGTGSGDGKESYSVSVVASNGGDGVEATLITEAATAREHLSDEMLASGASRVLELALSPQRKVRIVVKGVEDCSLE